MKNYKFLVLVLLLGSFVSCDKVLEELANDNTVLLSKKLWTFDSLTGFDEFGNLFASTFLAGATYQFMPDGTYTAVILGQLTNGNWEFNSDKTVITLDSGSKDTVEWSVDTLNETTLIITFPDEDALTGIITITFN